MKSRSTAIDNLVGLGLTADEAVVYVLLVERGALTANEIADHLKIVVNTVYRLVKDLEQKGFVKDLGLRPKRFQAVSPALAVEQLANRQVGRVESMAQTAIKQLKSAKSPNKLDMELLTGRADLFDSFVKLARTAKHEVLVISVGEPVPEAIWQVTSTNLKRGVEHKFIFHKYGRDNIMLYKRWQTMGVDVRHLPADGYHLNIFDSTAAILSASNPTESKERTGVIIYNRSVIEALRAYFFQQWAAARRV